MGAQLICVETPRTKDAPVMADPDTLKWFATLGVGGILAGFMFVFYRKDQRQFTEMWQAQATVLTQIVKDNTQAITANTMTIQALHRRDDRIEEALVKLGFAFPHRVKDNRT